jgi:hypothetical protein
MTANLDCCDGLSRAIDAHGLARRALSAEHVINAKNGRSVRTLLVLRSGEFRKDGVVVNYCPFCGTQVHTGKRAARSRPTSPKEDRNG